MLESYFPAALAGSPFFMAGLMLAALGAIMVLAGLYSLAALKPLRFAMRTLMGLLLLTLGALAGAVALGVQGYHALTQEDVAARISVYPAGPQRFAATVRFPDGRQSSFNLAGDEIYVDARVLKWKPLANVFGLHTAYELDRIAGRFRDVEQERTATRTVFPLGAKKKVDLFGLRRRYAFLEPLLDAEYGSGSFVPVSEPAELELRVSATGLLIRDTKAAPKQP